MKVLVISDSFKGTMTSREICEIARPTVADEFSNVDLVTIPVADGGEGTVESFVEAIGAEPVTVEVTGPYSDTTVKATYARAGYTAIIEAAQACGLPLVESLGREKDPFKTTSYGVGELMLDALENGCVNILLGLGGTSTNDGGCGLAAALDTRFYNKDGEEFIPVGGTLKNIARIDTTYTNAAFHEVSLTAMCDVDNPTVGAEGAAFVFAPQKGAPADRLFQLDDGLKNLCDIIAKDLSVKVADLPGGGAAGGMGAGCVAFFDGKLVSGIDAVLDAVNFDDLIKDVDLIITGEGHLDSQSMGGKAISGIVKRADNVPVVAIVGSNDCTKAEVATLGLTAVYETGDDVTPLDVLLARAKEDWRRVFINVINNYI